MLISGRGTNLGAIIDAVAAGTLPVELAAVVCNEPDAPGVELARRAGHEVTILHHRDFPGRERFDAALARAIDRHDPDLVVLAGFMRILTGGFVRRYRAGSSTSTLPCCPTFRDWTPTRGRSPRAPGPTGRRCTS